MGALQEHVIKNKYTVEIGEIMDGDLHKKNRFVLIGYSNVEARICAQIETRVCCFFISAQFVCSEQEQNTSFLPPVNA